MIWGGSIVRSVVAVGMCCLTVLGAAPRLDCHCPDRTCQVNCESGLADSCCEAATTAPPTTAQHACCRYCKHPTPQPEGTPTLHRSYCHCDMQVVRDAQLPVARDSHVVTPHVLWLAVDEVLPALSRSALPNDRSLFTGLPPDDPVSRAQILRL